MDRDALAGYLRLGYVAQPHSIYREIRKLPPGTILTLAPGKAPAIEPFWDARRVALDGLAKWQSVPDDREAVDQLDTLLRDAVRRRMIADVPLGAFLSGGIDSSTVVALMQAQSNRPVRTFSIGFDEQGYDEAAHAKAVAKHLGTDHTELYVDAGPRLRRDPAPAGLVRRAVRRLLADPDLSSSRRWRGGTSPWRCRATAATSCSAATTATSGREALWRRLGRVPAPLRSAGAAALRALSPDQWNCVVDLVPERMRPPQPGDKLHKLAGMLGRDGPDAVYRRLVSFWEPDSVLIDGKEPAGVLWDDSIARDIPSFPARMMFMDTVTYLPDDILTKVDRATMAVSLEARVPLLDHRVVELAWTLPLSLKVRNGRGKWILRQVLYRYVPEALFDRPKMGFGVPIDSWLRGPLRDWAEDLLAPRRLKADGLLRPEPIATLWREHLSGRANWHGPLWVILMFQAWQRRWA